MKAKKQYVPFLFIAIGIVLVVLALLLAHSASKKADTANTGKQDTRTENSASDQPATASQQAEEETEVLLNEGDAQQELGIRSALAEALPFSEGDDKICAIAYLGEGAENQEQNLASLLQSYLPDTYQEYLDILPVVDYGGTECYLIVSRYQESKVSLNCLEMTDEGRFQTKRTDVVSDGAFLLYCNPSELYANAEVSIRYGEQAYVIMPRLSSIDGRLEQTQVALDLTQEQVYQIETVLAPEGVEPE